MGGTKNSHRKTTKAVSATSDRVIRYVDLDNSVSFHVVLIACMLFGFLRPRIGTIAADALCHLVKSGLRIRILLRDGLGSRLRQAETSSIPNLA